MLLTDYRNRTFKMYSTLFNIYYSQVYTVWAYCSQLCKHSSILTLTECRVDVASGYQ